MLLVKKAKTIKWEQTYDDGADNATVWYGAKAIARIGTMAAFAVVAADE